MSARDQWTPAQRETIARLRASILYRPFWLVVRNPAAPKGCTAIDGLLLHRDHNGWRTAMTPCELAGCNCTVWALTPAEAKAHRKRRPFDL